MSDDLVERAYLPRSVRENRVNLRLKLRQIAEQCAAEFLSDVKRTAMTDDLRERVARAIECADVRDAGCCDLATAAIALALIGREGA